MEPLHSIKIVGAGIAGLFLAILLDKAGIPYEIYERAKEVKPLGKQLLNTCTVPRFCFIPFRENERSKSHISI
jgi:flavin-dependent dehydrogenase